MLYHFWWFYLLLRTFISHYLFQQMIIVLLSPYPQVYLTVLNLSSQRRKLTHSGASWNMTASSMLPSSQITSGQLVVCTVANLLKRNYISYNLTKVNSTKLWRWKKRRCHDLLKAIMVRGVPWQAATGLFPTPSALHIALTIPPTSPITKCWGVQ